MKTETKEAIETVFQAACTGFLVAEAHAPGPDRERFKAVADALHIAWPEIIEDYTRRILGPVPGETETA